MWLSANNSDKSDTFLLLVLALGNFPPPLSPMQLLLSAELSFLPDFSAESSSLAGHSCIFNTRFR